MNLLIGKNTPDFAKDTVYRFMKAIQINWIRFSTILSSRIIKENRESNDTRSMGELFLYFSDEMSDITWIQAFQIMLQMFRTMLTDNAELSDEKINELVDAFMDALPALLKSKLQVA